MEKYLTLSQAAGILNVTVQTVRAWDKAGKIKTIRTPGNQRRIPQSEIERLLCSSSDGADTVNVSETVHIPSIVDVSEIASESSMVNEPAATHYNRKKSNDSQLLMCKDIAIYNITENKILHENLLPGCLLKKTLDYSQWMKTRYSTRSNTSARRLMLRAFGSDNHEHTLKATRALSLSDCYWLKQQSETVSFYEITPYRNKEWDGTSVYTGGSISTLFTNGAADKRWIDSQTLLKINSYEEIEPYDLCSALGIDHIAMTEKSDDGINVKNFTTPNVFFESMEQSGFVASDDNPRETAVVMFKELAVTLFVIDYLVEHDDRHWGNYGFLRSTNSGEYLSMAPYFDFDWAWSGGVILLPDAAFENYNDHIYEICTHAKKVVENFKHGKTIAFRADELLKILDNRAFSV